LGYQSIRRGDLHIFARVPFKSLFYKIPIDKMRHSGYRYNIRSFNLRALRKKGQLNSLDDSRSYPKKYPH